MSATLVVQRICTSSDTMLKLLYTLDSPHSHQRQRDAMVALTASVCRAHGLHRLSIAGREETERVQISVSDSNTIGPNITEYSAVIRSTQPIPHVDVHSIHKHLKWRMARRHASVLLVDDLVDVQLRSSTFTDHMIARDRIHQATRRSSSITAVSGK